jgi:hypothetical protein
MRSLLFAVVLTSVMTLLLGNDGGCGVSSGGKEEGEPCTRTDQCMVGLVCRGGECMVSADAGSPPRDAGAALDAGAFVDSGPSDSGLDADLDAGRD